LYLLCCSREKLIVHVHTQHIQNIHKHIIHAWYARRATKELQCIRHFPKINNFRKLLTQTISLVYSLDSSYCTVAKQEFFDMYVIKDCYVSWMCICYSCTLKLSMSDETAAQVFPFTGILTFFFFFPKFYANLMLNRLSERNLCISLGKHWNLQINFCVVNMSNFKIRITGKGSRKLKK